MPTQLKSQCPNCGKMLKVEDSLIGKRVKCPACKKGFEVKSAQYAPGSPSLDHVPQATETIAPSSSDTSAKKDAKSLGAGHPTSSLGAGLPTPPLLGRFQLQEFLGQGGFGRVYKAFDPQLDR